MIGGEGDKGVPRATADDTVAYAPGAGTVVRALALESGLSRVPYSGGAGTGPPHTIGRWASAFGEGGPGALIFE